MENHSGIMNWATASLNSKGYSLVGQPEMIQETPWSNVIRLPTLQCDVFLKQPAPLLANEARVIQFLAHQFNSNVPCIIADNDELHCFLMKDAGISLRKYLNEENKPDLLCQAIKQFTAFQRSTEGSIQPFLKLGIPDWRLNQLPGLYWEIINDKDFLKEDGVTESELEQLNYLYPLVIEQIKALSQFGICETLVQPDFNTNNILIDPDTQKFTLIDLGELAISHPFFSLHNFLYTATVHHEVKEQDLIWHQMLEACLENWSDLWPKAKLLEGYLLSKTLWPIYSVCVNYHFMHCVDLQALNSWYVDKPNRLASTFRHYINSMHCSKLL
ncbi:phosphotransferase [Legionella quateirensis]|uniref:Phosphotransferase enzyme family n=1 Tax=Legionella quateirensis TaxID=45072 RepID=A0A378L4H1_9GAMM|nr:phosphotransferase [Legionella quateirensis]KTD46201.1 Phosphotransferase enzyme family protein [Legionella quateirensis]STY19030.1 Phosphotransferase enzyme family [Legionella quateirensis]